jgi:colanic acid biosynthesis glycosyl transferase WcaI
MRHYSLLARKNTRAYLRVNKCATASRSGRKPAVPVTVAQRPSHAGGSLAASKILIHAINFTPELIGCAKYTTELAQFLERRGHRIEVVTAPPHYPGWFVRQPYRALAYSREMLGAIAVVRCPMLMKTNGGGLWRLLAPLTFAIAAAPMVVWRIMRFRPDVVMCVEPTLFSSPAALIAAKLVCARTVLHVQDLEVDAAFAVGHIRGGLPRAVAAGLERRLLGGFDRIVTISRKMRAALLAKGLPAARLEVLRNWVDLEAIKPWPRKCDTAYRAELGIAKDRFVVLYAGHVGVKQALDVVLEAARRLAAADNSVHFVIAGDGPMKAPLQQSYADLANVSYLPLQPADRLDELLSLADLHVLPQHQGAADLVLPSKLGGMLASARLIVATVEPNTELFELLAETALLTPAGDAAALAEAILRARRQDMSAYVENGLRLAETLSMARLLPLFEQALLAERQAPADRQAQSAAQPDITPARPDLAAETA